METPVFFLDTPAPSNVITLDEDTSRHVLQVLRMKPSERLKLTDGAGNLFITEIVEGHKKKCTVKIINKQPVSPKAQAVCVGISLLKNTSRFEWFLEKATEIGVTEIVPMLCSRTEKQQFRYDRMKQILVSAMLQSKQSWLPVLHQPVVINHLISLSTYHTRLIAHCEDEMKKSIADFRKHSSVQILIGPEGDFTPIEISYAFDHGFEAVTLGDTRLRTETAGVVAATVLCI